MDEGLSVNDAAAPLVLWLGEPACHDPALVGGKTAQLSRLATHHPVPDAFCITTLAYAAYRQRDAMPGEVADALFRAYLTLSSRDRDGTGATDALPVAVRSSALGEDGVTASFAGQHATHLNVRDPDGLLQAVEGVWRSALADSALAYRRDKGMAAAQVAVAVLVQRLVACDVSGVVFSIDPVALDDSRIVVSASWGLGESLMGGSINPDRWVVDKESLSVLEQTVGDKETMTITQEAGTREVNTPRFLRQKQSLTEGEVRQVATLAIELERTLGQPVDVEFAFEGGRPVLLQCRPVTSLDAAPLGVRP